MPKIVDEMTGLVYVKNTTSEYQVNYIKSQNKLNKIKTLLEEVLNEIKKTS